MTSVPEALSLTRCLNSVSLKMMYIICVMTYSSKDLIIMTCGYRFVRLAVSFVYDIVFFIPVDSFSSIEAYNTCLSLSFMCYTVTALLVYRLNALVILVCVSV